eukprot:comp22413_c0_seq1/m.54638 comp22413_c0_seq1/g.54638  ORF comp22413_c0_seq1/g.54638 comp22413_c0_seq1/m.54638 type:complete len:389 (-) comp22413_c0_seq1:2735-3901(-)
MKEYPCGPMALGTLSWATISMPMMLAWPSMAPSTDEEPLEVSTLRVSFAFSTLMPAMCHWPSIVPMKAALDPETVTRVSTANASSEERVTEAWPWSERCGTADASLSATVLRVMPELTWMLLMAACAAQSPEVDTKPEKTTERPLPANVATAAISGAALLSKVTVAWKLTPRTTGMLATAGWPFAAGQLNVVFCEATTMTVSWSLIAAERSSLLTPGRELNGIVAAGKAAITSGSSDPAFTSTGRVRAPSWMVAPMSSDSTWFARLKWTLMSESWNAPLSLPSGCHALTEPETSMSPLAEKAPAMDAVTGSEVSPALMVTPRAMARLGCTDWMASEHELTVTLPKCKKSGGHSAWKWYPLETSELIGRSSERPRSKPATFAAPSTVAR